MSKGAILAAKLKIKELEKKVEELEQANLKMQEYFLKISEREEYSPFSGNPKFSSVFKFTIDLEIQRLVWLNSENDVISVSEEKLFLADINSISSKLISKLDKRRFTTIIEQYSADFNQPTQTLLRIYQTEDTYFWALACFEKVTYPIKQGAYLQVQLVKLSEEKEFFDLCNEFIKQNEKIELYQKVEMLTERQREILCFLGKGFTSKEIAENLNISFHTVEAHRKSIAKKTKTHKRAALITLAAEVGIIR